MIIDCFECQTPIVIKRDRNAQGVSVEVQCTSCRAWMRVTVDLSRHSELDAYEVQRRRNVNR